MRAFAALMAPFVLAATAGATIAAQSPRPKSMDVVIARSAEPGCEPHCREWIAAQGAIDDTTLQRFERTIAALGGRKVPVLIDSAGGSVEHAFAVARLIRAQGLEVAVGRTAIKPCAKPDRGCADLKRRSIHLAMPEAQPARCASSCAFLLAGGVLRHVGPHARVGLHQIQTFRVHARVLRTYRVTTRYRAGVPVAQRKQLLSERTLSETRTVAATPDSTYARIRTFFTEMGVGETVMPILMSAPHSSIHWLRSDELTATRLATDFVGSEQLLLQGKQALTSPVGPTPPAVAAPREDAAFSGTAMAPASAAPPADPNR